LDADNGDLGECVQAPIARRLAPNVCSAPAPPGACSQATTSLVQESSTVVYALLWRTCLQRIFQVFSQLMAITLYMLEEIVRSSFTGRGDPSELYSCTSLPTKTNHDKTTV